MPRSRQCRRNQGDPRKVVELRRMRCTGLEAGGTGSKADPRQLVGALQRSFFETDRGLLGRLRTDPAQPPPLGFMNTRSL